MVCLHNSNISLAPLTDADGDGWHPVISEPKKCNVTAGSLRGLLSTLLHNFRLAEVQ